MEKFDNIGVRGVLERILDRDDITIVDLHSHIVSEDVHEKNPEYHFRAAIKRRGIDFVFETEHDRVPLLYGSDKPINGHILPGSEISTKYGHVSVLVRDNEFITVCLNQFSEQLHKKYQRRSSLHPETLLNYIRDNHDVEDNDVVVVFPHSFQRGGIFHNEKNAVYPKLWLPSTYKQRKYFLEWTNSRRSPDSKTGARVLEMVQDRRQNLLLVAGSDAHKSGEVGMAGVVLLGNVSGEDVTVNLLGENYIVYHIHLFSDGDGRVMTNSPRADDKKDYKLGIKKGFSLKSWS